MPNSYREHIHCRVVDKLRMQQGASMIIALAFFLICAMITVIIVQGASANAERVNQQATEEQSYLELSSATSFVESMFLPGGDEQSLMVTYDGTDFKLSNKKGDNTGNGKINNGATSKSPDLANWITSSVKTIATGGSPSTTTIVVKGQNAQTGKAFDDVSVKFSMASDYTITGVCSTSSSSYAHTTEIYLSPTVTGSLAAGATGSAGSVNWPVASIARGGQ